MTSRAARSLLALLALACGSKAGSELDDAREFERELDQACGVTTLGDPVHPVVKEGLLSGRIAFEPEAAEQCIRQLRATSCDPSEPLPGWCRQAYSGSAATGEQCQYDVECAGDAFCESELIDPSGCAPRQPPGTRCFSEVICSAPDAAIPACLPDEDGAPRCVAE